MQPLPSVTVTVIGNDPAADGTPEMMPVVDERVTPPGKVPVNDHVNGASPGVAVSGSEL